MAEEPTTERATKRPSFQFYPQDWMTDHAVRELRLKDRGAWIDILCAMHSGQPYGYLTTPNGTAFSPKSIANLLGIDLKSSRIVLRNLEQKGVIKRDINRDGQPYFSKRMVEDEAKRIKWRDWQKSHRHANVSVDNESMSGRSSSSPSSSPPKKESETAFFSNGERRKKEIDCEWCGLIPDEKSHKKCHVCFRPYKAGENDDNHRC